MIAAPAQCWTHILCFGCVCLADLSTKGQCLLARMKWLQVTATALHPIGVVQPFMQDIRSQLHVTARPWLCAMQSNVVNVHETPSRLIHAHPACQTPHPVLTPLVTAVCLNVQAEDILARPVASRSSLPARGSHRPVGNRSRNPSGGSSALRDGRAAEPATAAGLAGQSASLAAAAAAEAAPPPGATAEVAASPVGPLADPQPAPAAAAEGVQSPLAARAALHSEVVAQAADLTAPVPQAADKDEQGTGTAQVSCFIQTSDRDIRASRHRLG